MQLRFWRSEGGERHSSIRELKDHASRLAGLTQYGEAAEVYRRLMQLESSEPMHRIRLGEMYLKLGREAEAVRIYEECLPLLVRLKDLNKAIAVCSLLMKLRPDDSDLAGLLRRFRRERNTSLARQVIEAEEGLELELNTFSM